MTVELAQSVFRGGPKDDLATADVYSQKAGGTINSIQKLVNNGSVDLTSVLRGGASLGATLPVITGVVKGVPVLNKANLIARLAASSGAIVAGLRNMSPSLAGRIASNIPQEAGVLTMVGGIAQQVDVACLDDLPSLGSAIAQITGNKEIFGIQDKGAQIGVYTGIIQEAIHHCSVGNLFGSIMGAVTDPYILSRVAAQVLPAIVGAGDFHSLASISQVLSSGATKMIYPRVVSHFVQAYKSPASNTVQTKKQDYQSITGAFSSMDPQWNSCSRAFYDNNGTLSTEQLVSVEHTAGGSDDFHELVKMRSKASDASTAEKLQVLGTVFDPITVDDALQQYFPLTVTGAESRVMSISRDPRSVAVFA